MPVDLVSAVLIAFAYLLIPGAGICLAIRAVASSSIGTFAAMALGVGFAFTAMTSFGLALVASLTPVALTVVWLAGSVAVWFLAIRAGAVPEHLTGWWQHASADPWGLVTVALTVSGVAFIRWTYPPLANMGPTAMRYWGDALEIADGARIPPETLQWGVLLRPATSKSALNTFNAGMSLLLDRDPLSSMAVLLFVVSIALVVIMIALLAELGIGWLAPVGAMVLLANQVTESELTSDLTRNLAENWGRLAAFGAVLASMLALRRVPGGSPGAGRSTWLHSSGNGRLVVAGLLLATAVGTHLVAAAVGALFVGAFILGQMIVRGAVASTLRRVVTLSSVALIGGGLTLALPPGDLGFRGAVGDAEYEAIRSEFGLSASFDPTRFIVTGSVESPEPDERLRLVDLAEAFVYRVAGRNVQLVEPGHELSVWVLILPTVFALSILGAILAWGPEDLRIAVICAGIVAAVLFLLGVLFAIRYDLYALERFGNRRLFNYAMLPYVIVFLAGAEWLLRVVGGSARVSWLRASAVAGVLTIVVGATLLPSAGWLKTSKTSSLRDQVELLRWVGTNIPCEGRVLADRRTLGTFQVMSGHAAVLEGMGPHVRPTVLARAIGELFRAREFFEEPEAHIDFLRERGVVAVVATQRSAEFAGWARIVRFRAKPFRHVPFLHVAYRSPVGTVYLVTGARPDPSLPAVHGRPGFRCPAASG